MLLWPFSDAARLNGIREVIELLAPALDARVCIQLWDGSVIPLGKDADPNLRLAIHGPGVISSLLRWPTLDNFMRLHAAGHIEYLGTDLVTFVDMARGRGSSQALRRIGKFRLARKFLPFLFYPGQRAAAIQHAVGSEAERPPDRENRARLIQFHYDVSNDMYALFLDPEMQYSCGYFTDWKNSLAQCQLDKMEMICRKLRLRPGETLLDVGCGWGGLSCYAAMHYGVKVHGVTLSAKQHDYAQAKVRRLGLQDRVTVELKDFSDVQGVYDKIASVGMVEHVGLAHLPGYFRKLHSLLAERGLFLNHAITRGAKRSRRRFLRSRQEHKLLRKYIFPGSEIDHIGHTLELLESNQFMVHDVEGWREHYALTCKSWCQNLTDNRAAAEKLVGPEMVRMWLAYLAGSSICFQKGSLRVFQTVVAKRGAKGGPVLPASRQDLYDRPFPSGAKCGTQVA